MTMETVQSPKGPITRWVYDPDEGIDDLSSFLDLLASSEARTVAIEKRHLEEGFFDLKTGIAGAYLQKVSNYRRRLIILGDFTLVESKALRDFIYESNKTGQVVFAHDMERGIALLR